MKRVTTVCDRCGADVPSEHYYRVVPQNADPDAPGAESYDLCLECWVHAYPFEQAGHVAAWQGDTPFKVEMARALNCDPNKDSIMTAATDRIADLEEERHDLLDDLATLLHCDPNRDNVTNATISALGLLDRLTAFQADIHQALHVGPKDTDPIHRAQTLMDVLSLAGYHLGVPYEKGKQNPKHHAQQVLKAIQDLVHFKSRIVTHLATEKDADDRDDALVEAVAKLKQEYTTTKRMLRKASMDLSEARARFEAFVLNDATSILAEPGKAPPTLAGGDRVTSRQGGFIVTIGPSPALGWTLDKNNRKGFAYVQWADGQAGWVSIHTLDRDPAVVEDP